MSSAEEFQSSAQEEAMPKNSEVVAPADSAATINPVIAETKVLAEETLATDVAPQKMHPDGRTKVGRKPKKNELGHEGFEKLPVVPESGEVSIDDFQYVCIRIFIRRCIEETNMPLTPMNEEQEGEEENGEEDEEMRLFLQQIRDEKITELVNGLASSVDAVVFARYKYTIELLYRRDEVLAAIPSLEPEFVPVWGEELQAILAKKLLEAQSKGVNPDKPAESMPGQAEKNVTLEMRVALGYPLWNDSDRNDWSEPIAEVDEEDDDIAKEPSKGAIRAQAKWLSKEAKRSRKSKLKNKKPE